MVSRNCNRQTSLASIHDHAVEKLDTTKVSGIGDLMRDIAGEKGRRGNPGLFYFAYDSR